MLFAIRMGGGYQVPIGISFALSLEFIYYIQDQEVEVTMNMAEYAASLQSAAGAAEERQF